MRSKIFALLTLLAQLMVGELHAEISLYAGPEIYYMKRTREGGTRQEGRIDGVRFGVERRCMEGLYLCVEGLISEGRIEGRNRSKRRLTSEIEDRIFEGRIGYSLYSPGSPKATFTPFVGYGRFEEINRFTLPSPLQFTFTDTFNYFLFGFLSGYNFTPLLSMGINAEFKTMMQGKSQVHDDPLFEEITLTMNDELQARIEFPLTYRPNCWSSFILSPFFEFRHFGGREDFPFDFVDTKFYLAGLFAAYKLSY